MNRREAGSCYVAAVEDVVARARLLVYESFRDRSRPPSPAELGEWIDRTPLETWSILTELEREWDAIVLVPGSPLIWMAEPFSALPTNFEVVAGERRWWGNCVWDALGIVGALGVDASVLTRCPVSGVPLELQVTDGQLTEAPGVVHFAVPAARWWESVGFT